MTCVEGKPESVESSWGVAVKLPSLFAGASQEVVFRTVEPRAAAAGGSDANVSVSFCYEHLQGVVTNRALVNSVTRRITDVPEGSIFTYQGPVDAASQDASASWVLEYYRSRLSSLRMRTVDFLRHAVVDMRANPGRSLPHDPFVATIGSLAGEATELMLAIEGWIARLSGAERTALRAVCDSLQGLRADLTGQITEVSSGGVA
jgi:hypothetical protein